jgi:hypothetical protein
MPPDEELTEEQLEIYDNARVFFEEQKHSNRLCIPLFLNSFGCRNGFGVYQLVEDVILRFPAEDVLEHLAAALSNEKGYVQYWAVQIASSYPNVQLLPPLESLLNKETPPKENIDEYMRIKDIKISVLGCLSFFEFPEVDGIIEKYAKSEKDKDILKHLNLYERHEHD